MLKKYKNLKNFLLVVFISQAVFTQNIYANKKGATASYGLSPSFVGALPPNPQGEKSNSNFFEKKVATTQKEKKLKKIDMSIEDIFEIIDRNKNLYEFKNYDLEKKSLDILIKDNKLGDFNGVNISSDLSYVENVFPRNYRGERPKDYRHYNKFLQNTASYGIFFVNFNYDLNRDTNKNSYISYGVEKNLKDIFYSKYKNNLRKNNFKKDINEIKYKNSMIAKKSEILDLYKKIFETKDEIKLKKKAYEVYKKEYDNQKKSYDLGMNSKINLEAVEYELESIKLELDLLEENLSALYRVGKLNYNIDLEAYNLLEINNKFSAKDLFKNYKINDIENAKLNLEIAKEDKSFSKYSSYFPDLYFRYERVDKNINSSAYYKDQDIFSLRFSKKLFDTKSDYKLAKIQVEDRKNYLEEEIKNIETEKIQLKQEYDRLSKNLVINRKKLNLEKKKYDIKKLKYKLNKASYLDVLDSYNTFLKQEIDTNRAKNELNTFIYKIMIRSQK